MYEYQNPVTPALELLTKRMEAGELKPKQFAMVARELMRTAIFAYKNRDRGLSLADGSTVTEALMWSEDNGLVTVLSPISFSEVDGLEL